MAPDRFVDTDVLLHLLSALAAKADRAETELSAGGVVSVQVLNEFASVASRKIGMSVAEIREILAAVRACCTVVPISEETLDTGLQLADRYGLAIYAAMIISSALLAGSRIVVSEDMQDGQVYEARLTLRNPFRT